MKNNRLPKLLLCGLLLQSMTIPLYAADKPTVYYLGDTFSTGEAPETLLAKAEMSTPPDWILAKTQFMTLKVPYSDAWRLAGMKVLPVANQQKNLYAFGRYVSLGPFLVREYSLALLDTTVDWIKTRRENDCLDIVDNQHHLLTPPPQRFTLGSIHGISYLSGGAKGCATLVDFQQDGRWFRLTKIYSMGADNLAHTVTPEMRTIITGIRAG